jgi:hypothetical protein
VVTVTTNREVGITPKLLDTTLGGEDIRGYKSVPPAWRKLYMDIVKKTLTGA